MMTFCQHYIVLNRIFKLYSLSYIYFICVILKKKLAKLAKVQCSGDIESCATINRHSFPKPVMINLSEYVCYSLYSTLQMASINHFIIWTAVVNILGNNVFIRVILNN